MGRHCGSTTSRCWTLGAKETWLRPDIKKKKKKITLTSISHLYLFSLEELAFHGESGCEHRRGELWSRTCAQDMGSAVEMPPGIEMAITFPVSRALGAWLIQVTSFYALDSPEKWVLLSPHLTKGGPNACRVWVTCRGHTDSKWWVPHLSDPTGHPPKPMV